ncbi:UDP-N-acetylmuramate dehydrogenase [Robiginitalea myxolifaciens]|uniref:UDP-N-acetylenolpyruvoylglucosamine reductase n=1 Tax=Robiginitalea myxolifaciens TaxID=400055 RepID=A0A1I6FPG1_9FLAO|nr:UDP-N-acetylmuramate dehydrogenase [Robiginitalea myxolifaciens]SFR31842.1 UDP-N-acetylmuramate dehydrogenase [Robiginitalea myxolifaciens]
MRIEHNISLRPYNTFGIEATASHFVPVRELQTLKWALGRKDLPPPFILSGGSNILLGGDLNALVLYIDNKGKQVVWESEDRVRLEVAGGESWHGLVLWCLEQGYGGLENLSLIPGKVGTAPIQNIGAYGVELKDVFHSCQAVALEDGSLREFDKSACAFGYRDSIFKQEAKGKYVIWSVTLELTKRNHQLNTDYGAITQELSTQNVHDPGPREISDAVIAIRRRKLPDPAEIGNSGSFFKNPVVNGDKYAELQGRYPEIPGYPQNDGTTKVPAGWLIEKLGFKGIRRGDAGVHKNQALVLVNYGEASGEEVYALAMEIQAAVRKEFGILLTPEVNIIK